MPSPFVAAVVVAVVAALLSATLTARAQIPGDSSHLRRGIVGTEAGYGQTPGAAVFFFSSPTTSWLLGIDRVTSDIRAGVRGTSTTSIGVRVGLRKWAKEMTGPFKLFVGAGASAADATTDQASWLGDSFGYGELGSAWFLSPYLSLNATGELSFACGKDRTGVAGDVSVDKDRLFVRGTRFRAGAALYLF